MIDHLSPGVERGFELVCQTSEGLTGKATVTLAPGGTDDLTLDVAR